MPYKLGIVGGGKIAHDQHLPVIASDENFALIAAVTRADAPVANVPNFRTITAMKRAHPEIGAVVLCTPPEGRHALAIEALDAGLDVLNEKPPAATFEAAENFAAHAKKAGRVLYQTWHSREAGAVAPAAAWLRNRIIRSVHVLWKEDVRVWHPSQDWIWQAGIGVFDPGINAISVVTHLLPGTLVLQGCELYFPENRSAPIAANLSYGRGPDIAVTMEFDFGYPGPPRWEIEIKTDAGMLTLSKGAAKMAVDGEAREVENAPEYVRVYRKFAGLLETRDSDVDFTPFRHVTDALARGRRVTVAPFHW